MKKAVAVLLGLTLLLTAAGCGKKNDNFDQMSGSQEGDKVAAITIKDMGEIKIRLFPLAGSLCMANRGSNTNGSQFFLTTTSEKADDGTLEQVEEAYQLRYDKDLDFGSMSETAKKNFKEHGGAYWLYRQHTVFGQVYEGLDVLHQAESVATDEYAKPLNDLIIEKITISEYGK